MIEFEAVGKMIICEKAEIDFKSKGGLILPEGSAEPQNFYKAISVGDGCEKVRAGDVIMTHRSAGQEIRKHGLSSTRVVKEDEVYAIVRGV